MTDAAASVPLTIGARPTRREVAWRVGTVVDARSETPSARRIILEVPDWPGNDAGSHLDVRLTAPDGYQATRSYSIASAGDGIRITLAVDELPDGEVSPFLVQELRVGDQLEVHGPLGAYFVWPPRPPDPEPRPVQLIAGGSGVVPLFAMASGRSAVGDATPFRMLYSVRSPADVFFRAELEGFAAASVAPLSLDLVYTRQAPDGWPGRPGRITRDGLAAATIPASDDPRVYVCGPTPFVETVADWMLELGHDPSAVRTERFGGS